VVVSSWYLLFTASCRSQAENPLKPAVQNPRASSLVDGLLYILSTGCQWRAIPKDFPPRSTLFGYFQRWEWDGTLDRVHHALYQRCREQAGRTASPTAAIIDSQSVKSAEKGGPRLTRTAMTAGRKSKVRSATSLLIPSA
jgi:transposase